MAVHATGTLDCEACKWIIKEADKFVTGTVQVLLNTENTTEAEIDDFVENHVCEKLKYLGLEGPCDTIVTNYGDDLVQVGEGKH